MRKMTRRWRSVLLLLNVFCNFIIIFIFSIIFYPKKVHLINVCLLFLKTWLRLRQDDESDGSGDDSDEDEDDSDEDEAMEEEGVEEGDVDQNFRLELMKVLQQQNALVGFQGWQCGKRFV